MATRTVTASMLVRTLLADAIDYAGLFPPASHSMDAAVRHYARSLNSPFAWALGRLAVPASSLPELRELLAVSPELIWEGAPWFLAVIVGEDLEGDLARVREVARHSPRLRVSTIEVRAGGADGIEKKSVALRRAAEGTRALPFIEIPLSLDVHSVVVRLRESGVHAKARLGGGEAAAIPGTTEVLAFLDACVQERLGFKLTAGLHHAIRGTHPLTYEPDSARAPMHGFLNVLVATSLLEAGHPAPAVAGVLDETDAQRLRFGGSSVSWNDLEAGGAAVGRARGLLESLGSCSFDEPLADLQTLGLV
jgi:hypothetical protein